MKKPLIIIIAIIVLLVGGFFILNSYIYNEKQGDTMANTQPSGTVGNEFKVTPISHATMVLNLGGQVIYNDPTGGAEAFARQPEANIILVSDIHGDHFNTDTLTAVSTERTIFVIPQAVADELPESLPGTKVILKNGEKTTQKGIEIEAIPMYNIPESATAPHTKGRGNGYILSANGQRIYIAGDTSATPEMKALQNIDVAFVPMNLPYTMGVAEAAEGVLAFKPKVVHPYHYRGQDGLADVNKFKEIVNTEDPNIKVDLLNFYPNTQ
jgi:L-ascorbate metabolism protein UlaG (beta-lactamase superfamily)